MRIQLRLQNQKNGEVNLEFLRQQLKKAIGQPSFCLAGFHKPPIPANPLRLNEDAGAKPLPEGREKIPGYRWADPTTYPLLKEFALYHHRSNPTQAEEVVLGILYKDKTVGGI